MLPNFFLAAMGNAIIALHPLFYTCSFAMADRFRGIMNRLSVESLYATIEGV